MAGSRAAALGFPCIVPGGRRQDDRAVRRDNGSGAGGRGHLRASHADREQVIGTLKAAFVQRRLAKDEFSLRAGQALASRTWAELAVAVHGYLRSNPRCS